MKTVGLNTVCCMCHKEHTLIVKEDDYQKYISGKYLTQDCFPYLKAEERELLISHICPECWNNMFPEEDEEDVCEITPEDLKEWQDASCGRC